MKNKEYVFFFIGGGWNAVNAKTKRGAIKLIKEQYKDSKLTPDYNTVHVFSDPKEKINLNSLFD